MSFYALEPEGSASVRVSKRALYANSLFGYRTLQGKHEEN